MRPLAALLLLLPTVHAAEKLSKQAANRPSAIALRKRIHVNPLITEPDTIEFDWGGAFSIYGPFTLPATIRYTPRGSHTWWGRTEFSLSFDSLNYDGAATHFGDRASLAATCVVHDGEKLDIAIAPTASFLLRGDSGARLGATTIVRYDAGRSSAGVTAGWTSATRSSATNPATTIDLGAGYGYHVFGPITAHTNVLWEKSTATARQVSLFEGFEYQLTPAVAIDFTAQHLALWGGPVDHQIAVGLTVSTPHLHR